jgi:hypothetical protein
MIVFYKLFNFIGILYAVSNARLTGFDNINKRLGIAHPQTSGLVQTGIYALLCHDGL